MMNNSCITHKPIVSQTDMQSRPPGSIHLCGLLNVRYLLSVVTSVADISVAHGTEVLVDHHIVEQVDGAASIKIRHSIG